MKTGRYWRAKHIAARTADAKLAVLAQYEEQQRERELHV